MLQIVIPSVELFDDTTQTFIQTKTYTLNLEHSLLSISKWESKWHKPFLSKNKNDVRTYEEILDYIKCMTLNKNIPDYAYKCLTTDNINDIKNYIDDPMTATTVRSVSNRQNEIVTSEVIYYWMISFNIPFECEKWHLNRLLMLVKVCNAMNAKPTKKAPDMISRRKLNEARLAASKR